MNDFLTGREADSAGSLPQAGVWGLLFRSPILICLGQLAPGKEEPSCSLGRATVHLWRFFYPGAFLSLSTAGRGGSSRTHQASPPPPPPLFSFPCSSPWCSSSEACCQQLSAPVPTSLPCSSQQPCVCGWWGGERTAAPQKPLCPAGLYSQEVLGETGERELSSREAKETE